MDISKAAKADYMDGTNIVKYEWLFCGKLHCFPIADIYVLYRNGPLSTHSGPTRNAYEGCQNFLRNLRGYYRPERQESILRGHSN